MQRETSTLITAPAEGTPFATVTVTWELGLDCPHDPTDDDELRILAADGSVVARAIFRDVDRSVCSSLRRAAMRIVCPGFGGSFVVALYDTARRRRYLASPFSIRGPPLDRGEGRILVETAGEVCGPLRVTYNPSELFGGTFVVCPADGGDNDGHLEQGLFPSDVIMFAAAEPRAVVDHRIHSMTLFAPSAPGRYQVRYLKAALASVPHCVASSCAFAIEDVAENSSPALDLRRTRGNLVVWPSAVSVGESLVVRWDFAVRGWDTATTAAASDDASSAHDLLGELSDADSIRFVPYGRGEFLEPTESLVGSVRQRMVAGTTCVTAPNVEGLYDVMYVAARSGVPMLLSSQSLRVQPVPCRISRRFASVQVSRGATDFTADSATKQRLEAATAEEAGAIDFIVPRSICGEGDLIVVTSTRNESVVARVAVTDVEPASNEDVARLLHDLDFDSNTAVREMVTGRAVVPLVALAQLQFSSSFGVRLEYYSASLRRSFGETHVLLDGLSAAIAREAASFFPDVDIVTPAAIPVGELVTVRVHCENARRTRGAVLVITPAGVPDVCFRSATDDPGAIHALSAEHVVHFDLAAIERDGGGSGRIEAAGISEAGMYAVRIMAFLDGLDGGGVSVGAASRICFAECVIHVADSVVGFEPLPHGNLPVTHPAECLARFEAATALLRDTAATAAPPTNALLHAASDVVPLTLTRRRTLRRSMINLTDGEMRSGDRILQLVPNLYRGNHLDSSNHGSALKFVNRSDFQGAIVAPSTVTTDEELCVTVHLLHGDVGPTDELLLLDEFCTSTARTFRVSEGITARSDGSLSTVIVPPIDVPGNYILAYHSKVINAVPFVSKAVTVTPGAPDARGLTPAATYIKAARRIKSGVDSQNTAAVQVVQPPLRRLRALVVGCAYPGREVEARGSLNDVEAFSSLLVDTLKVPAENVVVLHDFHGKDGGCSLLPSSTNIYRELSALVAAAAEQERRTFSQVVFYFSGLGALVKRVGCSDALDRVLLPADYDWGPRMLHVRHLLGFMQQLASSGVATTAFIDAGDLPGALDLLGGGAQQPGIQRLHARRALAGIESTARWRAAVPPPGMRPSDTERLAERRSPQSMPALPINAASMGRIDRNAGRPRAAPTVMYVAGRDGPTWEAFQANEGKTLGVFTAALCRALRLMQARAADELRKELFVQMSKELQGATFVQLHNRMHGRGDDGAPLQRERPIERFGTWEVLHELVMRHLWEGPFRSQKPQLFLSDETAYLEEVFDLPTLSQ